MTQRIQELKQLATVKTPGYGAFGEPTTVEEIDIDLFARLIVQECLRVAVYKTGGTVSNADIAGYMAAGRLEVAKLITDHFPELFEMR